VDTEDDNDDDDDKEFNQHGPPDKRLSWTSPGLLRWSGLHNPSDRQRL
jgi:hypothetical protein